MTGSAPVVPVFPAGYEPVPADFNTWIQTPFASLTSRVVFRAAKTTAQSLTAGVNAAVAFDNIIEDPYSGWNAGSSTWTPPAAWSGTYIVKVGVFSAAVSGARLVASIGLNGTSLYTLSSIWTNNGVPNGACGDAPVQLVGGQDQVAAYALCSSAVALDTTAGQQSTMEITWYSN